MAEQEVRRSGPGRSNQMQFSGSLFKRLQRGRIVGRAMTLSVMGRNIHKKGSPLMARVGSQPVLEIIVSDSGLGFSGLLKSVPNNGDRLYVQYQGQGEMTTNIIYRGSGRSRIPVA